MVRDLGLPRVPRRLRIDGCREDFLLRQLSVRGVAQLAEHRFPKPGVAGSIPAAPVRGLAVIAAGAIQSGDVGEVFLIVG